MSAPYDLVRVRDGDVEFSMPAAHAEGSGLAVLKGRPAVDEYGRALPAKTITDKGNARGDSTATKEA